MSHYRSFLIRIWQADINSGELRIRLEAIGSPDKVYHFSNLDALLMFLHSINEAVIEPIHYQPVNEQKYGECPCIAPKTLGTDA